MAEDQEKNVEEQKSSAYELGGTVLLGLFVLTAVEYAFGVRGLSIVALFIIILIKAGMILNYYMHVSRLWSEEEGR
jgi:cytochrome c oxidase subunit IV